MIHNTVNDQLSILLIPNFIHFMNDAIQLKDEIIEVALDEELMNSDPNFKLLSQRYGSMGSTSMVITNANTLFVAVEFRNII